MITFRGGVHPPAHKGLTDELALDDAAPPAVVRVPLQQHIGAPAKPVVEKGAAVKLGQTIAEPGGFVSVPHHAPVSGTVKAIKEYPHASGRALLAIEIENDGQDTPADELEPMPDWRAVPVEALRDRVRAAGIVGLGGAAFPTHVKLSPPKDKPIHTVIINGAECEPYLTCDYRLMIETPDAVLVGADIVRRCVGAERVIVGIEDNKPRAVEMMERNARDLDKVEIAAVHTKYPQGSELQLIRAVAGAELPKSKLPMEAGVVVQNVGTALAIYEAVVGGKPLVDRAVTVTGPGVVSPRNLRVRLGTLCNELIEQAGGMTPDVGRVIMGGPMMGLAMPGADVPCMKSTSGLLLLLRHDLVSYELNPCIRCGKCETHCPAGLATARIGLAVELGNIERAEALAVLECIECGCCSYVCPARRPMTQLMRVGKSKVLKERARRKIGA
ncbi:MAG: electron transport complex subunit RsxC [Verrucomicrobia bacterium]|nr:electron transport complex subunit RsxC [Verrucomicrobiota bacterium]